MALDLPVELATERNSYQLPPPPTHDIRNPNWIPILQSNVDTQRLSFFEKEVVFSPPEEPAPALIQQRPTTASSHKYSKSSSAPELIPDPESIPVPVPRLPQIYTRFSVEEDRHYGSDFGGTARPSTSTSTPTSLINSASSPIVSPVQEERALPPLPHSRIPSNPRKRLVGVAKASKKSSLRLVREPTSPKHISTAPNPLSSSSPLTAPKPPPKTISVLSHAPVLGPSASAVSLASSAFSDNSTTTATPASASRHTHTYPGRKSESRSMEATPRMSTSAQLPDASRSQGYPELASFMTKNDMVVFRRFDEMHVQLLLYLQELISQLEEELGRIDFCNEMDRSPSTGFGAEKDDRRRECLEKLREVVGEYDQLFSSWSQMHQSKASKSTVQKLITWVQTHNGKRAGGRSYGAGRLANHEVAMDEAYWSQNSKDLSSVKMEKNMGRGTTAAVVASEKGIALDGHDDDSSSDGGREGGGGIKGFFANICGKR